MECSLEELAILELIYKNPSITQKELSAETRKSLSTVKRIMEASKGLKARKHMRQKIRNSISYNLILFLRKILQIIPGQTIYLLVSTAVTASLPAVQTFAVATFIDNAEKMFRGIAGLDTVILPLAAMLAVIVLQNAVPSVTNLVNVSAQNRMKSVIRESFVKKRLSLQYYYMENEDSCALIHRVCEEPEQKMQKGLQNICDGMGLVVKCVSLLGIVAQASLISAMVIFFISVPFFYLSMKLGKENYALQNEALEVKRRYQYLAEILTQREYAKERSLFGYNPYIEKKYDNLAQYANKKEAYIERKRYINMKSGSMIMIAAGIVMMLMLLPAVQAGKISTGLYVGLVSAVFSLVQGMSWKMSGVIQGCVSLNEYLKDMNTFLNMEEKKEADTEPGMIPDFHLHDIEFRHVSFRYPGEATYVLKDCSFIMEGKKCYAIVGRNGAGKSTLTKLLIGLYDDYEGEILINGRSIKEYSYAEMKWMISVVFQDFAKYGLSIRDNILLGDRKCTDTQLLQEICDRLEINDFVQELPNGLNSVLGKLEKESVDLSEGQWQRLAIARLLYSMAPINILDEPTAALDPKAEAKVYENFQKVNEGRFAILITHRMGAARLADEILVLEEGRIAEQGSHESLLKMPDGRYKGMFESQRSWYGK